ncbi:MAG: efflux RND transporter periplasmic adaptor subunit [bacterium]
MDRPLTPEFLQRENLKRAFKIAAPVIAIISVLMLISAWIHPAINRNRIRTAKVERGPIEATISASGTVVPEVELALSSPIDSRVLKVLKKPGAAVVKGESILELDVSTAQLNLERVNDQIALKENQQAQLRLDLDKTLADLQTQLRIKKLRREFLQAKNEQEKQLFAIGGSSKEQLRQTELEQEIAELELQQLDGSIRNTQSSLQNQLQGVTTEIRILQKERAEAQRQLELATAKAERDGILTFALSEEGATVRKGDVVARIADLRSFRVQATVSDVHASRLALDLPVKIKVNEDFLTGAVAAIYPRIENGVITMSVNLEDKSNFALRSNLRVDVFIITASKSEVLRLKKVAFVSGEGLQELFVIHNSKARKTPVHLGLSSFEYFEVLEGLAEGEEVIISDMRDFAHVKEVKVN